MNEKKIENILTMGSKSDKRIIHFTAAKEFIMRNPHIVLPNTGSEQEVINKMVINFKSEFPVLCADTLKGAVMVLLNIKFGIFKDRKVISAISILGSEENISNVLDIMNSNLELFAMATKVFNNKDR